MSQVSALHHCFYYIFLLLLMVLSAYSERSQQSESCHNFYIVTLSNFLQLNPITKSFQIVLWRNIWTVMYHPSTLLSHADIIMEVTQPVRNLALQGDRAYLRMRSLDQCSRVECLKYCLRMVFCCYQVYSVYWVPTVVTG